MTISGVLSMGRFIAPLLYFSCVSRDALQQQRPITVDGQTFVHIPTQTIQMGRDGDGVPLDEQPAFTIEVTGFYIATTEVSNAQYAKFLNDTNVAPRSAEFGVAFKGTSTRPTQIVYTGKRYRAALGRELYPVSTVSYHAAVAYCDWIGGRLPTETEWVSAAKGGASTLYPWGDEPNAQLAQVERRWRGHMPTAPVATFAANSFGVYDVIGNVWEWTSTTYRPYERRQFGDGKERKVLRGGDWYVHIDEISLFTRYALEQSVRGLFDGAIGFRCVLEESQ